MNKNRNNTSNFNYIHTLIEHLNQTNMNQYFLLTFLLLFSLATLGQKNTILIEAESFANKGGWVVDQQFMDQMGSPFLMAHGMGMPVKDAGTTIKFPSKGSYRMFVRTRNWAARWTDKDAPGKFQVLVNGKAAAPVFGTESPDWQWQDGGVVDVRKTKATLSLKDLTGFNGRCDAILFTTDLSFTPPSDLKQLADLRAQLVPASVQLKDAGKFDFVVIGGGMDGTCAEKQWQMVI